MTPGALLNTEEFEYFEVCIRDAFCGKVLVYALDFGAFGGIVDGIIGLLSAILSGDYPFCGGYIGLEGVE